MSRRENRYVVTPTTTEHWTGADPFSFWHCWMEGWWRWDERKNTGKGQNRNRIERWASTSRIQYIRLPSNSIWWNGRQNQSIEYWIQWYIEQKYEQSGLESVRMELIERIASSIATNWWAILSPHWSEKIHIRITPIPDLRQFIAKFMPEIYISIDRQMMHLNFIAQSKNIRNDTKWWRNGNTSAITFIRALLNAFDLN